MAYHDNRYSSSRNTYSNTKYSKTATTNKKKKKKYRGLKIFLGGMILLGSAGITCKLVKDFFPSHGSKEEVIEEVNVEDYKMESPEIVEAVENAYEQVNVDDVLEYREFVDDHYGNDLSPKVKDAIVKVGTILTYDNRVAENTEGATELSKMYNDWDTNIGEASLQAIETGQGICNNFTQIFNALINDENDMEAYYVKGTADGGSHGWSLVCDENGQYQQVDMTWIDNMQEQTSTKDTNVIGAVSQNLDNFINFTVLGRDGAMIGEASKELPDHSMDEASKELIEQVTGESFDNGNVVLKVGGTIVKVGGGAAAIAAVAAYIKHKQKQKDRQRGRSRGR